MNQDTLRKYARTLLQYGVNLQQDQTLVNSVDVENKDFAVIVTEEAYQLGARGCPQLALFTYCTSTFNACQRNSLRKTC